MGKVYAQSVETGQTQTQVAEADEDRLEQAGIWLEEAIVNSMEVVLNSLVSRSRGHAFQSRWKSR